MKKNKKKLFTGIIISIVLLVASILLMPKIMKSLKFGLDLQGGFEVLYKVEGLNGEKVTEDMVTSTYKTIMKRIDVLGVSEPVIIVEGTDRIRVQLAGVTDQETARNQIGKVANLTFRNTSDKLLMNSDVISGAKLSTDEQGKPAVALSVKDKDTFYKITDQVSKSSDQKIVIWLDFQNMKDSYKKEEANCGSSSSKCISAATVEQAFTSDVIIKGSFTQEEAKNLAELINSGSLQTKLTEISSKTVSASFGEDSLKNTLIAGIIGLSLVILLMIILYRFSGLITSMGLIVYTFLSFLLYWLVGGVLTLPGIAAMLLGIGMAVDSNVIAFSKIKDEMRNGKNFKEAYKAGNKDSFKTILDANITTLIVAIILFIFGESSVKGFATMLMISIFVTMVIMVGLVRLILNIFMKSNYFNDKAKFFMGINPNKLDKKDKLKLKCDFKKVLISLIIITLGIITLGVKGFNLGIDFKGGSSITLKGKEIDKQEVQKDLEDMNYKISSIETDGTDTSIVIEETLEEEKLNDVKQKMEDKYDVSVDIGVVSNVVKKELVKNTIYSVILAAIGIMIYISLRFTFRYGIGAILALLHDVLIVIGIFALFRLEVNTVFIAAILSIIGYSINDTVVIFDQIKDLKATKYNNLLKKQADLDELIEYSINNIKGRSIITSVTTLIPIISLIILGSKSILNFNIAMFVGVLVGTYSSLFIATYVFKKIERKFIGKKEKKWYEVDIKEEKKVKGVNC